MAGLLGQGFDDPQSSAIMALAGGLLQGNFGGGLLGANSAYQGAQDGLLKRQLGQAQLDNYRSEVETRRAQLAKQQQMQEMLGRLFGGGAPGAGAAPAAPPQIGQLGSGSFGMVPPPAGAPAIPQAAPVRSGLAGASIDQIAALHALGGPDLLNAYKAANEGFERKPGSFYDIPGQGRQYVADPTKGMDYQNGRISTIPGYGDFLTGQTLATEAPKTLLSSAANVNLRKNPDGTESPVSSLAENPTLQNVLGGVFGQRGTAPAMPASPSRLTQPGDGDRTRILQSEMTAAQQRLSQLQTDPRTTPDIMRRAQEDVAALTKELNRGGVAPGVGYGKTTAQETQDKANAEYQNKVAGDFAEQRKGIMSADFAAPGNIAKYQQIGKLLEGVDGGKFTPMGTEFASALNGMGLKIDKNLGNKQAAMAMANEAALQLRSPAGGAGMPGAMSDQDRTFLASMTPNQAQSAEGRKQVIEAYIATQRRSQQVAQFARRYEQKYGRLDNGFFDQLQQWSNANSMFGGK